MAIYMIDYENVKTGGLNGISRLTSEDRVIIFYSENANRLTFDLHRRLMECPAQIEYREVTVGGHNALDFQLVTYLGYLIAQNPTGQYLIISYDRGFEYVVNFWRKDGLCIGLLPYLKDPSYALSKVIRGEYINGCGSDKAPKQEDAVVEFISDEEEEAAEEPVQQAVEELPAEEAPVEVVPAKEVPVEEAPAEETPVEEVAAEEPVLADPIAEEPVAEEASAEAPVEAVPVKETPAMKPAKKKTSAKKDAKQAEKKADHKSKTEKKPTDDSKADASKEKKQEEKSSRSTPSIAELKSILGDLAADDPEVRFVRNALEKYKTKLGLNNGLVKHFGNQRAGEIYQKVKPFMAQKKER